MQTIVDLSYYNISNNNDYTSLIQDHQSSHGHLEYLNKLTKLFVVRIMPAQKNVIIDGINFHFMKGSNSKMWLPFRLHSHINSLGPEVILVHGFDNPLQVLLLKLQTNAEIIIQYHGGGEPKGKRGLLQKIVKHFIKHYIFTAKEQADIFIEKGLISPNSKIFEILEGSTDKKKIPKFKVREQLQIPSNQIVFLWVGRLIDNKDPLTVIKGLSDFLCQNTNSSLLMIYQDKTLLSEVQNLLSKNEVLNARIKLIGEVSHKDLDAYYSAANYYISGSFYEGSGYSLFEAMACGCVPLVTDIPSFRSMTNNGGIGALWQAGNCESLKKSLKDLLTKNYMEQSNKAINYFNNNLSFEAIANKQLEMVKSILNIKG